MLTLLRNIKRAFATLDDSLNDDPEIRRLADAAYAACIGWFGEPSDPHIPFEVWRGPKTQCNPPFGTGAYTLYLAPHVRTPELVCMCIGHEIYHRVTMQRGGLRREVWADEMLAILASLWFLEEQGFAEHARMERASWTAGKGAASLTVLRGVRRRRRLAALLGGSQYPEGFTAGVCRFVVALETVLSREALCGMASAPSLEAWLEALPAHERALARRVLGLDDAPPDLNLGYDLLGALGHALATVGDQAGAVAAYGGALSHQPASSHAMWGLGAALWDDGDREAAERVFRRAARLTPPLAGPCANLAQLLWNRGEWDEAAEWYEETLRRDPSDTATFFYYGNLLHEMGRVEQARAAWHNAVATNGEARFVKAAQKRLEAG